MLKQSRNIFEPAMAMCQLPVKDYHFLPVLMLFWSHSCPHHALVPHLLSQPIPHTKLVMYKKM